jgi:hypothetical protein
MARVRARPWAQSTGREYASSSHPSRVMCRFVGRPERATQVLAGADGRRPTSAKARNRGGEAGAMVAQLYGDSRPVGRAVASSCDGVSGGPADAG